MYTRSKNAEPLRDFGNERGFSNEPKTGYPRMFSDVDVVLSVDNRSGGFCTVAISEKELDSRVGLKLNKTIGGKLSFLGVDLYWRMVVGKKFPVSTHPIITDTTTANHIGHFENTDRMRNVPTNKEHQAHCYLNTVYPEVKSDDVRAALAKYLAARFWPGVVLSAVKDYEWNDNRLVTLESFNTRDFSVITKTLWHADNHNFQNVQKEVIDHAMSIINTHDELSKSIRSVPIKIMKTKGSCPKSFVNQTATVFEGLISLFRINPNVSREYLGQANRKKRRELEDGEKIFSGYLNRSLHKHGFRAEISKNILTINNIVGAEDYDGTGGGFNDPQAVRSAEQFAHYLWGELLNLAYEQSCNSDATVQEHVSQAS